MSERVAAWGSAELDREVRQAAFEFLTTETARRGNVLPWQLLTNGFRFEGQRVCLLGQQGIFKPEILSEMPISITTAPLRLGHERPYDDQIGDDGVIRYRYRGTDPQHRDNRGLRLAMQRQIPLIYFYGIDKGEYLPSWPAFVVAENVLSLAFDIMTDEMQALWPSASALFVSESRRRYVTRATQVRLHQVGFRQRVIRAYRERCAICRLRHVELLDAAHILPDGHPKGEPIVPNGLALCKLHHAAFDENILGIRPDLVVEIRPDVLLEIDGPMLVSGLQAFQGQRILIPSAAALRPAVDFLAERFELFRQAG
jgi:putative restriction endonuclease